MNDLIHSKLISVVLPAYNETGNIALIAGKLENVLKLLKYRYEIIFVNDGSKDSTQELIISLVSKNENIHYIELSRNFGHQNALKAGIDMASGDCVISMDCDMQHPPEIIPEFVKKWEEGYEVVYSIRQESKELTGFKRGTSKLFYSMINSMSDINLEPGTADFRLLDRQVVNIFSNLSENEPFIRGLIKWLGFKQFAIEYVPSNRHAGTSQYTLKKMMRFALQGITSFSTKPLYTAVYLGFIFSLLSLLYIPYVIHAIYTGQEVTGWASVIMTIVFFGGVQLIILGIIGIYIGKLFMQSKQRPTYIIRSTSLKTHS
ncbi:MAG: glycosyl transferase family 2 [Sphingobacteriales bacterium]|nr:glycosyl transferase family 2 [Sphingobacteriales bacterium]